MSLDDDLFRDSMAHVAASVSVVSTVDHDGRPHGMTVTSLCSLSMRPPLLLVCLQQGSATTRALCEATRFAVSVLGVDQEDQARRFATREIDRFADGTVSTEVAGLPVVEGALAWLLCTRHRMLEAGDHTILIGQVEEATTRAGHPLLYYGRDYRALDPSCLERRALTAVP
jgi:flavin reductase ActVB